MNRKDRVKHPLWTPRARLLAALALGLAAPSFAAPPLMQDPPEIQRLSLIHI